MTATDLIEMYVSVHKRVPPYKVMHKWEHMTVSQRVVEHTTMQIELIESKKDKDEVSSK